MRVIQAYDQTYDMHRAGPNYVGRVKRAASSSWRRVNRRVRLGCVLLALVPWTGAALANSADAQPAADFSLPSITDRNLDIRLADYRGSTVYLDFWSSWCLPCRESLPLLGKLQEQLGHEDFAVITVNLDSYPSDGRSLMEKFAVDYPVASDIGWRVARQFGLQKLPAAFLISRDGAIRSPLPRLNNQSYQAIFSVIRSEIDAGGMDSPPADLSLESTLGLADGNI